MVGMIYERCHTRDLAAYGGLAKILPVYSVFFMILTLAAIGFPTTSGFTGEFLVLLGAFGASWQQYLHGTTQPLMLSTSAVVGVVLGALYMLWFAQRFLFGAVKAPHQPLVDLSLREKAILGAIVAAVFALGLYPEEPMRKTEVAARQYQQLVARQADPAGPSRAVAAASSGAARAETNRVDRADAARHPNESGPGAGARVSSSSYTRPFELHPTESGPGADASQRAERETVTAAQLRRGGGHTEVREPTSGRAL
jgi:hypothetical protein